MSRLVYMVYSNFIYSHFVYFFDNFSHFFYLIYSAWEGLKVPPQGASNEYHYVFVEK